MTPRARIGSLADAGSSRGCISPCTRAPKGPWARHGICLLGPPGISMVALSDYLVHNHRPYAKNHTTHRHAQGSNVNSPVETVGLEQNRGPSWLDAALRLSLKPGFIAVSRRGLRCIHRQGVTPTRSSAEPPNGVATGRRTPGCFLDSGHAKTGIVRAKGQAPRGSTIAQDCGARDKTGACRGERAPVRVIVAWRLRKAQRYRRKTSRA